MESSINKGLAYQLRAMREARNWSQEELAALVDMPQTAISRLESPNYGKPTITTLKRMARVYDVGLDVRFVPFGLLVDRMSKTPRIDTGLTSDSIDVPSFEEEGLRNAFDPHDRVYEPLTPPLEITIQNLTSLIPQSPIQPLSAGKGTGSLILMRKRETRGLGQQIPRADIQENSPEQWFPPLAAGIGTNPSQEMVNQQ